MAIRQQRIHIVVLDVKTGWQVFIILCHHFESCYNYVTHMPLVEGVKCASFHTQFLDPWTTFLHTSLCEAHLCTQNIKRQYVIWNTPHDEATESVLPSLQLFSSSYSSVAP